MHDIEHYLISLQKNICDQLSHLDGHKFKTDIWANGKSCVLQNGHIFEKAGVNFSHVSGDSLPPSASANHPEIAGRPFEAMGVSLVLHPHNPYVPTTHCNIRFFMAIDPDNKQDPIWWFGGGFDLTPYYAFEEDCIHWHQTAKNACDPFGKELYPKFKHACDEYFYLKHRQETRGIGGLFFDDLNQVNYKNFDHCFNLTKNIGDHFLQAYLPIVEKRKDTAYGEREKAFQCYRRGRYVEYNLIYDRGTLFGLQFGGRIESILISLPPQANWIYNWHPNPGSPEDALTDYFLKPKNWVSQ